MKINFQVNYGTPLYLDDFHVYQHANDGKLLINEVNCNPSSGASYVELYNSTDINFNLSEADLEMYLTGSLTPVIPAFELTGSLSSHEYLIITKDKAAYEELHGTGTTVLEYTQLDLNTIDGIIIQHDLFGAMDQFNDVPITETPPLVNHLYLRKGYDIENGGTNLLLHWCDMGASKNGTPAASNKVTWNTGGESIEWDNDANWDDTFQPCLCNDVIIPSGGTQPTITTMDACARNVVVESGANLTILGKLNIGSENQ